MSQNRNRNSHPGLCKTLKHAITLNASFYENARNTRQNKRIALTIVVLAAISRAIGTAVILLINLAALPVLIFIVLLDIITVILGYYLWTFTIWKIGQFLKHVDPNYTDLLSPIGFAYAPQILNLLTLIPLLGRPIELVLGVWSLLAVIIAVRQGLDISTLKAALICLIGWPIIQIVVGLVQVLQPELTK